MKIYLLTNTTNDDWDVIGDAVVIAKNEKEAREAPVSELSSGHDWVSPEDVKVQYLGKTIGGISGVVLRAYKNVG